jgi:hypothetical protein
MHEPVMGLLPPLVALATGAGVGALIRIAVSARSGSLRPGRATEPDTAPRADGRGEEAPK